MLLPLLPRTAKSPPHRPPTPTRRRTPLRSLPPQGTNSQRPSPRSCLPSNSRLFSPAVTLWAFLSQVLDHDHSCRQVMMRLLPGCARGIRPPLRRHRRQSPRPACPRPPCTAHPPERTWPLAEAPHHWLWKGRIVKLVDGTCPSMPDTQANQKEYPQPAGQSRALGFPQMRLLVILSLAVGTVLDAALGPSRGPRTGESALFRSRADAREDGDILLADRGFCAYFVLAGAGSAGAVCRRGGPFERSPPGLAVAGGPAFGAGRHTGPLAAAEASGLVERRGISVNYGVVDDTDRMGACRSARLPHESSAGGDDAPGPIGGEFPGSGGSVFGALARRTGPAFDQASVADGRAAWSVAGDGAQGGVGASAGLQRGAWADGPGGAGAGRASAGVEFHGGVASVQCLPAVFGPGVGGVGVVAVMGRVGACGGSRACRPSSGSLRAAC